MSWHFKFIAQDRAAARKAIVNAGTATPSPVPGGLPQPLVDMLLQAIDNVGVDDCPVQVESSGHLASPQNLGSSNVGHTGQIGFAVFAIPLVK